MTKSPSALPSGGSKVIRGIIARKEGQPGNEANFKQGQLTLTRVQRSYMLGLGLYCVCTCIML